MVDNRFGQYMQYTSVISQKHGLQIISVFVRLSFSFYAFQIVNLHLMMLATTPQNTVATQLPLISECKNSETFNPLSMSPLTKCILLLIWCL